MSLRTTAFRALLALMIALALAACGTSGTTTAPAQQPAAQQPAAQQPAAPKPAAQQPAAQLDLPAKVNTYLSTLPDNYNAITKVDALNDLLKTGNALVVDVREPNEYADGHIPGSVNIPVRTLAKNLDKIPTDRPVVLSCASGLRASIATTELRLLGYTNVRNFYPGFKGWTAENQPVSKDVVEAKVVGAPKVDAALLAEVDTFLSGLPEGYYAISKPEALNDLLKTGNALVVDVREPSEYADGHIPSAVNIPIRTLGQNLNKIPHDKPVVLSCASGLRCSLAMPAVRMLGYDNVRTFPPSFKGWTAANMPVEK